MLTTSKVTYHPIQSVFASRNWRIVRCIKPLHYTHYSASLPTLRWRIIRWSQSLHHALCSRWLQTLRWRQSAFPCHTLVWLITNSKVVCYPVRLVFAPYSLLWMDAFESRKQTLLFFTFVCRRPHQNFAHLKNHKTSQKNEKQARERMKSSVQFKMVSMRLEKPICAPPHISDVSPTLPLTHFHWKMSRKR